MISAIKSIDSFEKATKDAKENPEKYWDKIASTFQWQKKWDKTLEYNFDNYNVMVQRW